MRTDSLSRFDIVTKASLTTVKKLMIDATNAKSAFDNMELQDVAFI